MTQQTKQGMRLRRMENPRKNNNFWLLQTVTAILASVVLLLTMAELTGLGGTAAMTVMVAAGAYFCIMYGLMLRTNRQHWFYYGALVLILLLMLIFRTQVLEGYRLFWNQMGDAKLQGTGWLLPEWELQLPAEKSGLCLTVFAVVISCSTSLVICFLITWEPTFLAVLLPAVTLAGMAYFGNALSFVWLLAILAASVMLLLFGGWGSRNAMTPVTVSWLIGGIAAAVLLLLVSLPGIRTRTQLVGQQVQETVHRQKYETGHTTLPEGDFTDYQDENKPPEAALIVTMEYPEMLYLRGYTGSVFDADRWQPLEKELLVKNKNLLYWLNRNAFDPNVQFSTAASELGTVSGNITVQNTGACSQYRYVPFTLCADTSLVSENLNTEGLLSDGNRIYSYTAVTGGAETISQVLQHLQQSNDTAVLKYRKAESGYRQFVRNAYLQVPQSVKQLLAEKWDAVASVYGKADNLSVQQAQECALRFLSQSFPEGGTPEDMELPLDIARGSTYQYATVATLTLRYFGIPARYAEGYVITEQMAAAVQPGDTLAVDGSCARAWVEVYQDGVGWIPMDMTPGLSEMIQENPDDTSAEGDGDIENPELDPEEVEDDSPMDSETEVPDPDGGSVVRLLRDLFNGFIKLAAVLAAIFLLLYLRRKYINSKKEKRFRSENRKDAICWITADTVVILEKLGMDRGNGSLRQLCEPVKEQFNEEYAKKFDEMIRLNDRAMFSSRLMEESHREYVLTVRSMTIQNVNTQVKWYRRLWLKWVRCLF